MRVLRVKGFGKNYFTLASILAYSSVIKLLKNGAKIKDKTTTFYKIFEYKEDDSSPNEDFILQNLILESNKNSNYSQNYTNLFPP